MKKLLSFVVAALLGLGQVNAQDLPFKVTCEGKEVNIQEGETLTFTAEADPFGTSGYVQIGPATDPIITNVSDEAIDLTCTISTSAFGNLGDFKGKGELSWCGFNIGSCITFDAKETRTCTLAPGESTDMQFHCALKGNDIPYGTVRATVKFSQDGEDMGGYTAKFVYTDAAGIESTTAAAKGVSVANGTLTYNFATAATRHISVFAADGKLVKDASATAKNGSVNLKSLQSGVYLYSVSENGKNVQSGKVLVK